MDKAKNSGHEVSICIVVRHLPRLNRSMNTTNGTNGSDSNIIDLHSDVSIHIFNFIILTPIYIYTLNQTYFNKNTCILHFIGFLD